MIRRLSHTTIRWAAALCVVVSGAACDGGPSGPGNLDAVVESARRIAGAVVVEVRGSGIRGFASDGTNQVYWEAQQEPGAYRVVVVNPGDAAPLSFTIQVNDLSAAPPTGTILEATSLTNLPLGDISDFGLSIVR